MTGTFAVYGFKPAWRDACSIDQRTSDYCPSPDAANAVAARLMAHGYDVSVTFFANVKMYSDGAKP